jgi:multidrug efflux pump subunit AcrB
VNVPQFEADVDREKAKSHGRAAREPLNETLQINLGSLYVNDFNRFGRTYQVVAQADQQFRDDPATSRGSRRAITAGDMVPHRLAGESERELRPGSRLRITTATSPPTSADRRCRRSAPARART